jgi:hypothetical protein
VPDAAISFCVAQPTLGLLRSGDWFVIQAASLTQLSNKNKALAYLHSICL